MSLKPKKHMVLTTFMLPAGYHKDSWRMDGSRSEELANLEFVADLTVMAEKAKLDAVFFGDIVHANTVMRGDIKMNGFYEPMTVLAALAARTRNIGLIGTVSTSFSEPYNVARQMCGLDHMSGGRAGWNIVTSSDGFQNFGMKEAPDPATRYRRATEFVNVVQRLWDSWEDGAVINDKQSGWYVDAGKIHPINHKGEFFEVAGPINMPRSPQGRPVLVQAGSSGPGMELGSSVADGIYTAQPFKEPSVQFYARFKQMAADKGRNPDEVKIIPGILPILGDTEKEALQLANELANHVHLENGRIQVGADLKMDLGELDYDERIPAEWFSDDPRLGSRYQIYRKKSVELGMTLRELIVDLARSTGHQWMAGTPGQVADRMVDWFESKACDGFNLNSPFNPGGFQLICDKLVPELQDRGYFREEYEGTTLRDNLGLPRPAAVAEAAGADYAAVG
ncbi:LLM class flavin-dependent oxidoreductase [Arthrobacter mobilis]|uniref:LLM class flavin-dependent oxidoreductase n=1 Tax=Arthrobacter mobilis TaxID=2724944 RepID=A0A7X6K444_9MICC|nr:LLM class flavin-dependent oxidoreductase [Arthrobacter mobilis]NKX54220.1 LLM class flavin-dependent oxidoreductase [Arthrobacter mobilis]